MSKLQLKIVIDREDRTYHFGDQISGKVILKSLGKSSCRKIKIDFGWRTHGGGNIDRGLTDTLILQGEATQFSKGDERSYPFKYTAPNGPVTYHGHYINVDWYLTAQVDISLMSTLKDEEDILLLPGESPSEIILGDTNLSQIQFPKRQRIVKTAIPVSYDRQSSEPSKNYFSDWKKILIILAFISPLGATAVLVTALLDYPNLGWPFALAVSAMAAIACVLIYGVINIILDVISKKKLAIREIRIEPQEVYTGDQLSCQLQLETKGAVYLDSIAALLTAEEEVVYGGGTNMTVKKHMAYQQSFIKPYKENLIAGRWISFICFFPISSTDPATFIANSNKLSWLLKLNITFKGWNSWKKTIPITVLPT